MKLHLAILDKLIELPTKDPNELRHILDDLGLEVKGTESIDGRTIYNIETLANRGDHLYALGIGRELSARFLTALKVPPMSASVPDRKASIPIRKLTEKCMRYALLEMTLPKGMKLRADVAHIMQVQGEERAAIVHLLNYILLELGQPMHAFDRDKIDGEISISLSETQEEVAALDGKTYRVPKESLVIRDRAKIVAVAGVIGCANSMVTPETTRVLIESASFDPILVRKTARAMGISTDASYTFERGCDVEAVVPALRRLIHLSAGAGGQEQGAHAVGMSVVEGLPIERRRIDLDLSAVRKQLNLPRLPEVEMTSRLKNLGFSIEPSEQPNLVKAGVPSWRLWDAFHQEDLTEDIVRSIGFSRVKQELPSLDYEAPEELPLEKLLTRIEPVLMGSGFLEVMTRSYYSAEEVKLLDALQPGVASKHIGILNSLESNYSHLRISHIIHMAQLLEFNLRRGVSSVKAYEVARVFSLEGGTPGTYQYEKDVLSLACAGRWHHHEWRKPEGLEELLALFRGALERIVSSIGYEVSFSESHDPLFHPGMQASIKAGRIICGRVGLIHPLIQEHVESKNNLLFAEFDVDQLVRFKEDSELILPSDFPSVKRDITLKISSREMASRIVRYIEEAKIPDLEAVQVVDNFRKEGEEFRRLTVRLTFQSRARTLESGEVDSTMNSLLSSLATIHGLALA